MRVKELLVQYRATTIAADTRQVKDAKSAASIVVPLLEHQAQEVFLILLTNTRQRLIAVHEIARGGLTSVTVPIRLIIRAALLTDATGIILAHNHPSGDPSPSPEDIALTRKVKQAGELFEIEIHDHLIVGDQRYVGLKEHGIL